MNLVERHPMVRIILLAIAVITASCSTLSSGPDINVPKGSKAVIGSFRIDIPGSDPNQELPAGLFMSLSKITLTRDEFGKNLAIINAKQKQYVLKGYRQESLSTDSIPFYISLEPGIYAIRSISFAYKTNAYGWSPDPQILHNISIDKGIPLSVARDADATYIGRIVLTGATGAIWDKPSMGAKIESETTSRDMYLQYHPGHVIKELLLPIAVSNTTQ